MKNFFFNRDLKIYLKDRKINFIDTMQNFVMAKLTPLYNSASYL